VVGLVKTTRRALSVRNSERIAAATSLRVGPVKASSWSSMSSLVT
jgi:hypothetical protein